MHFNLFRPSNEVFTTSLYEIDRILEERDEAEAEYQELRSKVPEKYWEYLDVFSKRESDKLPPHREYDHRITLESPNSLSFSPLYKMTTEEL